MVDIVELFVEVDRSLSPIESRKTNPTLLLMIHESVYYVEMMHWTKVLLESPMGLGML